MNVIPYSNKIDEYLKEDDVIDYSDKEIRELADSLYEKGKSKLESIKIIYEYVRDNIPHSFHINADDILCNASEVLKAGHGICFEKAHLLAALLRYKSIPTGFCYQKIMFDEETNPVLVYHGLNGVYISELDKWIRLDASGNMGDINAQFSVEKEQLAFKIRPELGEIDSSIVYSKPDTKIISKLRNNKTRTELLEDLPTELEDDVKSVLN